MILLVEDDKGEILAIIPFMEMYISLLGLRLLKKIQFIGTRLASYSGFIILPGKERLVLNKVLDYLKKNYKRWDMISLREIPEESKSLQILPGAVNYTVLTQRNSCPYIELPESMDLFVSSLSYKMRKNLRYYTNRLKRDGHVVEFKMHDNRIPTRNAIHAFADLHRNEWKDLKEVWLMMSFYDDRFNRFFSDVAQKFAENDWLKLCFLYVNGELVSSLCAFTYDGAVYYEFGAYDRKWSKYAVSTILINNLIEDAIKNREKTFDFMRGYEEYKFKWNTKIRRNFDVVIFKHSLIFIIYRTTYKIFNTLKNKLLRNKSLRKILIKFRRRHLIW